MRIVLKTPVRVTDVVEPGPIPRAVDGRRFTLFAAAVAASLLIGACGDDSGNAAAPGAAVSSEPAAEIPTVLATTTIWADVVTNVACAEEVTISTVVPPGVDPHSYEPSIADRQAMDEADLIVANGLNLEEGLTDTLEAVGDGGTPVFYVGDHIDTIAYGAGSDEADDHGHGVDIHDEHQEENNHDEDEHHEEGVAEDNQEGGEEDQHGHHGGEDPHVWFDPIRVADMLPELGQAVATAADLDSDAVAGCVADYQQALMAVDSEITDIVATIAINDRKLVTNHDGFGYFADRYGFEVIGTVIPSSSTLAEANPAQLEELARTMRDAGVEVVFAESQHSTDEAEALASLAGDIEVVTLLSGTLASPDDDADSGAETFVGLLRTNASRIAEALK